ncbi:MAG: restriction endonuclease subunit S [Mailhella sp.]|nr:restriction endonuclease subunit S [Mailhella sp.]
MLPEGWKVARIDEISSLVTSGARNWAQYYSESGSLFIRMMNLMRDSISLNLESIQYVDVREISEAKRTRVESGDILLSITAELGKVSFVKQLEEDAYISQHVAIVRINDQKANPCYIAYVISSKEFNKKLQKLNDAGAKAGLNLPTIRGLSFNLPPLAEQKKIAEILSTWDEAISVVDKQLENCRLQKKALMQQLLTGKKRLPGFSGEWRKVKLGTLLKEEGPRNKGDKVTRVLSVTNHSGVIPPEEQFSKRVASENISTYKIIRKGQFGYNPSRLNVGSFGRLDRFEEGILSPLYVIFSVDETRLLSDYFLTWMYSEEATQKIKSSTQGSVRDSVNFDALSAFSFMLPPIDEQKAISQIFADGEKELSLLEQKRELLNQEKNSLMQQLLTGKKRVAVEEDI